MWRLVKILFVLHDLDALEKVGYDRLIQEKYTGTKKDREGLQQLLQILAFLNDETDTLLTA